MIEGLFCIQILTNSYSRLEESGAEFLKIWEDCFLEICLANIIGSRRLDSCWSGFTEETFSILTYFDSAISASDFSIFLFWTTSDSISGTKHRKRVFKRANVCGWEKTDCLF
jgi:hypothetical protein